MKRCLVIPATFFPYNDTNSQIVYKHLRLLDMQYDVCALRNYPEEKQLEERLSEDPNYKKFKVTWADEYNNVWFNIRNVDLFKGLRHMKRYIESAVQMYDGQDYVYTMTWPCYTTRAGVILKKNRPAVRWIAAFSDPINHNPYMFDKETYRHYSLPEKIAFKLYLKYYVVAEDEANALEQADLLVFISEELREFMIEQYMKYFGSVTEESIRKKSIIVPLNYIPEWNMIHPVQETETDDKFILSHFGRIYGYRIIEEFIHAVEIFVRKYPGQKLLIEQYGEFRKSDRKLIRKLHLDPYFAIHGKIPYEECIEKMNRSDGVLLFDTILPDDQFQPFLPSKLMEYSLLEKNVLAVTTEKSPSWRIMKRDNAIACHYDREEILQGLEDLIIHHKPSKVNYKTTNEQASEILKQAIINMDAGEAYD
ncbi:MAG: hypothetical protein K6F23_09600 [Solobacterium sp.]|nr:hypothetical protein [Solobacterium sp.]